MPTNWVMRIMYAAIFVPGMVTMLHGSDDGGYAPAVEQAPVIKEEIVGIDTVGQDEPQGNWLFKRIWWERAEARYEKIRTALESIFDARMGFFNKRTELERNVLDPFYSSVGITQGELSELLSDLTALLERERKLDGGLSPQERDFLEKIEQDKATLEQLQRDVVAVSKLDEDLDAAFNRLVEQINRARGYEREAWGYFKEIARVLNDKKARELFYRMNVAWTNISEIVDYINKPYANHFNQVVAKVHEQIDRIKQAMQMLKEKGIDFKSKAARLEEEEQKRRMQEECRRMIEEEDQERDAQRRGHQTGILSQISQSIISAGTYVWDTIISIVTWPYRAIFGAAPSASQREQEEPKQELAREQKSTPEVPPLPSAQMSAPQPPAVVPGVPAGLNPAVMQPGGLLAEPASQKPSEAPEQANSGAE